MGTLKNKDSENRIAVTLEAQNISLSDAARAANVSVSTLRRRLQDRGTFKARELDRLAELTGSSVDWLMGRKS
ncbi:helix-turn-helix transcriptional regulator [Bifidobacterium mongoliense]|uniref:helix-turn-helix domain-containing protein n=1 Tax=Bifidobacterium mongoliense TaxID=518643 RepID=UPI0030EE017D